MNIVNKRPAVTPGCSMSGVKKRRHEHTKPKKNEEVHPEPEKSPSDSTCMLRLDEFDELIEQIMECHYDRGKSLG